MVEQVIALPELSNAAMGAMGGLLIIHSLIIALCDVRRIAYLLHVVWLVSSVLIVVTNQPDHATWYFIAAVLSSPIAAIIVIVRPSR